MNIAIISPEFPPYTNWGGIATFNYNLAMLLSQMNHNVHVITYDGKGEKEKVTKMGKISIHYIQYKTNYKLLNILYFRSPLIIIRYMFKRILPSVSFIVEWNIFSLLLFKRLYKEHKFSVIHTNSYHSSALLISLIYRKIPLILHIHGPQGILNQFETLNWDKRMKAWLETFTIKYSSPVLVACSKSMKQKILSLFPQLKTKICCIYNFIDTNVYTVKKSLNINNLVFVGRLEYRKGVDIVIDAFIKLSRKNKAMNLWLIGENGYNFTYKQRKIDFQTWFQLQQISSHIKKRIHLIKHIKERQVLLEMLKNLKGIAIFPSRYEPFGLVTIEAMALGYIVITSSAGGGQEIIEEGKNGFLTQSNVGSLSDVIDHVIHMSAHKINWLSNNAIKKVKRDFGFKTAKKEYNFLYQKYIGL